MDIRLHLLQQWQEIRNPGPSFETHSTVQEMLLTLLTIKIVHNHQHWFLSLNRTDWTCPRARGMFLTPKSSHRTRLSDPVCCLPLKVKFRPDQECRVRLDVPRPNANHDECAVFPKTRNHGSHGLRVCDRGQDNLCAAQGLRMKRRKRLRGIGILALSKREAR
jgi:hypothetical protein